MGFQKLLALLLLVAQCVHGFYPMEYLDILRLSGRAGLDSEEYFSKDETSRHDEVTSEDHLPAETRYRDDYSNSQSEYPRDYDSREDFETRTFSSLFEKPPQENDALYSPPKTDRYHKRDEYFGELSKKSISTFHRPRKVSLHSPEDLLAGASDPNNQPRSRPVGRSRRARLSDYDLYYPKRRYPEDSRPEYRSKSLPPSKPYDEYSSDYIPRHVDEPERPLSDPAYPAEAYTRAPYHEPRSKPLSKPSRKTYPRSSAPIKSSERDLPPSSTYSRQKSKDSSKSVVSRPLEREVTKKYPPRKFSETRARAPFDDDDDEEDDFRGKPLITTTSWNKEKRKPKHFSDENKHYLAATGYGKPVREQFHEQGTTGPHAYKFGYNTGDPENPMARYEEKGPDGLVKGSYSYVDPMGKLQVVHYESHPEHGFKTTYA